MADIYAGLPAGAQLTPQVAGLPSGAQLDAPPEKSSFGAETLKAPARIVGGIAQELGEAGQFLTGNRIGGGMRHWGEQVQQQNAMTPAFQAEHPILAPVAQVAEGAAKLAPYMVGDALLSAVAPEVGLPAAAGVIARGARFAAGKLSTIALPGVMGAAQGQQSYEKGVANGLSPDEALKASYAPAATTGAGMALMGRMSKAAQGIGGAAESLGGQFVKHAAADTGIMMGQGVATSAAEKYSGTDVNAKPLDQLKDPKQWLNAALTGGMFAGLGVGTEAINRAALRAHLASLPEYPREQWHSSVEGLAQALHPDDPVKQAHAQAGMLDRLQNDEPPIELTDVVPPEKTADSAKDLQESLVQGLTESVTSGGEKAPLDAQTDAVTTKILDGLKTEEPKIEVPTTSPHLGGVESASLDPNEISANVWAKQGYTTWAKGKEPNPEAVAILAEGIGPDKKKFRIVPDGEERANGRTLERGRIEPLEEPIAVHPQEAGGQNETVQEAGGIPAAETEGRPEQAPESDRLAPGNTETPGDGQAAVSQTPAEEVGPKTAEVKMFLTKADEKALRGLGHTPAEIKKMTPEEGAQKLAAGVPVTDRAAENIKLAKAGYKGREISAMSDTDRDAALRQIEAKASVTAKEAEPLTAERVKKSFPGQDVRETPEGHEVTAENGTKIRITMTGEIEFDRAAVEAAHGRPLEEGEKPVASFVKMGKEGVISLTEKGVGELDHETFHAAVALALSKKQIEQVFKKYGSEENAAKAYQDFRDGAAPATGWWNRIKELALKLRDLVMPNADTVFRKLTSGEVWKQKQGEGGDALRRFMVAAWHGSPHDHDKFDSTKIGTGEGGAMFGKGHYFAGAKAVAEHYRDALSAGHVPDFEGLVEKAGIDWPKGADSFDTKREVMLQSNAGDSAEQAAKRVQNANRAAREIPAEKLAELVTAFREARKGKLYQVELAPEEHEYLNWDKPLSEQPEVLDKLANGLSGEQLTAANLRDTDTGGEVYRRLVQVEGSKEAASELLRSLGIKGNKYLDEQSRDNTAKVTRIWENEKYPERPQWRVSSQSGYSESFKSEAEASRAAEKQNADNLTHNYVIFDDKDVKIVAKFSLGRPEEQREAVNEAGKKFFNSDDFTHIMERVGTKALRFIQAVDRTIVMASKAAWARPIKEHLVNVLRVRGDKQAYIRQHADDAVRIQSALQKNFKSDADFQKGANLIYRMTLYQLDPFHPAKSLDEQWNGPKADEIAAARERMKMADFTKLPPSERDALKATANSQAWTPIGDSAYARAKTIEAARAEIKQHLAALSPEQRDGVKQMFAQIGKVHDEHIDAVLKQLEIRTGKDSKAYKDLKQELETQARLAAYFPLSRHGYEYMVRTFAPGEDGKRGQLINAEAYRTEAQAIEARAKLAGKDSTIEKAPLNKGNSPTNIPSSVLAKLDAIAAKHGLEGSELEAMKGDLEKLWVNTLSRGSIQGSKLERTGVAGFSTDWMRTYAEHMAKEARATAHAKYDWQFADQYKVMRQKIDALQAPGVNHDSAALLKMQDMTDYLESQDQKLQAQQQTAVPVRMANRLAFMTMLTSPTMWIAHLAQPIQFTLPKLAAKFGPGAALESHYQFMKNWMSGKYADHKLEAWDAENGQVGHKVAGMLSDLHSIDIETSRRLETAGHISAQGVAAEAAKIENITPEQRVLLEQKAAEQLVVDRAQIPKDAIDQKKSLNDQLHEIYTKFDQTGREYLTLRVGAMVGTTELSAPFDLHDAAIGATKLDDISNKLTHTAGFFLRKGVSGARKAAATAAMDLAFKDAKFHTDGKFDFAKAFDYMAKDIVDDTLYNYDPSNRPAFMNTNAGKLMFQFQFFRFQTIGKVIQLSMDAYGKEFARNVAAAEAEHAQNVDIFGKDHADKVLADEKTRLTTERHQARAELAYMTASGMALAGAAGAPIAMAVNNSAVAAVYNAIAWLFEDKDDPWHFGEDVSRGLHAGLGDNLANVLEKGLPSIIGLDLSQRLGVGEAYAINGEPPEGMTAGERSAWYANKILGPAWSMVGDWRKAGDAISEGNTGDAVKYTSPNFVRNFIKANDLSNGGVKVAGKTVMQPEDVSMYDIALQMAGINPLDVSLAKEESQYLKNISTELSQRRSLLIRHLAEATSDGDQDAKERAIEKINAFSTTQPSLKITSQELANAVKKARSKAAGTLTKKEQAIKAEYGAEE
jgi:hypothetical protein